MPLYRNIHTQAHLGLRGEDGFSTIIVALVVAAISLAYAAAVYLRNDSDVARLKRTQGSEAVHDTNIANLAVAQALLRFPAGVTPATADNPRFVPAVYPDPYINPNNKPVKLGIFTQPTANAPWSTTPAGGLQINGYGSTLLGAQSITQVMTQGANLQPNSSAVLPSALTYIGPPTMAGLVIKNVPVQSTSKLQTNTYAAQNSVEAALAVPVPPPPVLKPGVLPAQPVLQGASVTIGVKGFGITSSAAATTPDGQSVSATLPPAAYSISNTASGSGFNLSFNLVATVDSQLNPVNPNIGLMTVTVVASGPGGTSLPLQVQIQVVKPVSCTFTPNTYSISSSSSGVITMSTVGPVASAEILNPVTNQYGSGTSITVTEPAAANGQGTLTQTGTGQVTSQYGGPPATCSYTITVPPQPPGCLDPNTNSVHPMNQPYISNSTRVTSGGHGAAGGVECMWIMWTGQPSPGVCTGLAVWVGSAGSASVGWLQTFGSPISTSPFNQPRFPNGLPGGMGPGLYIVGQTTQGTAPPPNNPCLPGFVP